MDSFKALRIHQEDGQIVPRLEQLSLDQLSPGDVVIRGEYSSVNYKDALAATGKGRILRRFPLVGGVDVAGTVVSSSDPRCKPGDRVVVTGGGMSETHDGGFSQVARVPGEWAIPLPEGLDTRTAMSFGTAGFTAALAIHRLEQNGQTPELGPVDRHRRHRRRGQFCHRDAGRARLPGHRADPQDHGQRLPEGTWRQRHLAAR